MSDQVTVSIITAFASGLIAIIAALVSRNRAKQTTQLPPPSRKPREPIDWRIVVGVFNLASAGALVLGGLYLAAQGGAAWIIPVPLAGANLYYAHDALVKRAPPQSN